ncbi:hypothetical protein ACJX0J_035002, partial [Zea mays]
VLTNCRFTCIVELTFSLFCILQKVNATAYHQALNHLEFMRQPCPANIGGDSKEILYKNMKKKIYRFFNS